ncbi:MAG: ShlB/FhaC/HecB family hemolysin secretion/activation protein [Synechococcales bacterium]|nr:ShlB/FhaC/HecB family hemolysin secretion/activation protein [Synechococcales bacterium]
MPPKQFRYIGYAFLLGVGTLALLPCQVHPAPLEPAALKLDGRERSPLDSLSLTAQLPPNIPTPPPEDRPRPQPPPPPAPETPPPPLPPPDELLQPGTPLPVAPEPDADVPQTVEVQQFDVQGSTVFDADDLAALAWRAASFDGDITELLNAYCVPEASPSESSAPGESDIPDTESDTASGTEVAPSPVSCCPDRINSTEEQPLPAPVPLSFAQLLRARSAITQLYINCGYITSGAILPPQTPVDQNNTVTIQVVEGSLEAINVTGARRLNSSYVRSRLAIATDAPLNQQDLLQALQLLQLDPLIRRIAAELQAGTRPSTNILQVEIVEADSFRTEVDLNNDRTPSIGSFERGISLTEANLLGLGDGLTVGYTNTSGSNGVTASYQIPVNPRNGAVTLSYGYTHSNVIEPPFDILGISADSFTYELGFRQPLYQTPSTEFALGLSLSRQETQTRLSFDDIGPFPLSPGADDEGRTRVTAVRFTQDWVRRSPRQVLAARSQFSLGLDFLGSTVNEVAPDSRFFAWRGQGQWVRQLDSAGTLVLARTDGQLTDDPLVPLEQFGLGGQDTVRGYRQDALLTDNGIFASLELQYPIVRSRQLGGRLYLVPFVNAGTGWNVTSQDPDPSTIVGTGLGLIWRQDSQRENGNLSAQLFFGIPLISIDNERERTWQENGVYFSIVYSPF